MCTYYYLYFIYLFVCQKEDNSHKTKDIILYVCTLVYLVVIGRNTDFIGKVVHASNNEKGNLVRQLMLQVEFSCERQGDSPGIAKHDFHHTNNLMF